MGEPTYDAFGFRFRVVGDVAARITPLLSGLATDDGADGPPTEFAVRSDAERMVLSVDGEVVFDTDDLGALVHQLVWEVTSRGVGHRAEMVLHAGTVTCDGVTVVVSGPSGSGKSTLVAALVEAGASYVTDEATEIDEAGHVVRGLARPIHLSRASVEMVRTTPTGADVLMPGGGRYTLPARRGAPVEDAPVVVILLGDLGGPLQTSPVSRADAIARLARERFARAVDGQRWLESLKNLSSEALLMTVSGGSVIERARSAKNFVQGMNSDCSVADPGVPSPNGPGDTPPAGQTKTD